MTASKERMTHVVQSASIPAATCKFHACDMQAMGNFPYPSTYILNGAGEMPAFPVRVACSYLKEENPSTDKLLSGFADSLGIFYNSSKVHATSNSLMSMLRLQEQNKRQRVERMAWHCCAAADLQLSVLLPCRACVLIAVRSIQQAAGQVISVARHTVWIGVPVQDVECYDFKAGANPETDEDGNFWDYQWCATCPFLKMRVGEKAGFSIPVARKHIVDHQQIMR